MTEPSDLDDRLARLAARKARAAEPAPAAPTPTKRARRRHPAAAARILSLGLSSSAFFAMVAAFGESTPAPVASARPIPTVARPVTAQPRTKVIVKYVHHTVFVDRAGRPVTGGTAAIPAESRPTAGAAPTRWTVPAAATPVAAPVAPALPNAGAPAPTPAPVAAAPAPAPAPRPTTPPPTVTTPPPPAAPVCSGSQCP